MWASFVLFYNLVVGVVLAAGLYSVAAKVGSGGEVPLGRIGLTVFGILVAPVLGVPVGGVFGIMALLAWSLFLHLAVFAVGIAWLGRGQRVVSLGAGALAVVLVGVAIDAFLIEPRWLGVTHHEVTSDALTERLRIVVVSDLQTDGVGDYERRALQMALDQEPDLILMPGDYVQVSTLEAYTEESDRLRSLLQELDFGAPLGAFAVQGNVDPASHWSRIYDGTRVSAVKTSRHHLTHRGGAVVVEALGFEDSFDVRLSVPPAAGLHVVFGHGPDFSLGDIDADLLIAGHTHGGQVRLPLFGPPVTFSRIPRDWAAGRTELTRGATLFVSRGVGMERGRAPRLRFLCPPEIVVIDVVPGR